MVKNEFQLSQPKVSVVIGSINRKELTIRAINSVLSNNYLNLEILYIDGGSTDGTIKELERYKQVKTIIYKKPGVSAFRNFGALNATGEIILYLDSDAELSPETIENVIPVFADESIGIVGVQVHSLYERDKILTVGCDFYKPFFIAKERLSSALLNKDLDKPRDVFVINESCLFVKRELFRFLGGFDEDLYPFGEDGYDFCWTSWKIGYRVIYYPGVSFHKFSGLSHSSELKEKTLRNLSWDLSNLLLIYFKNFDFFSIISIPLLLIKNFVNSFYRGFPSAFSKMLRLFFLRLSLFNSKRIIVKQTQKFSDLKIYNHILKQDRFPKNSR